MLNRATFIGYLCADPELRYTPSGTPLCTAKIGVTVKYNKGGDRKSSTLYMPLVCFGTNGENLSRYTKKGTRVYVEGRLQEDSWEYEGRRMKQIKLIVDRVVYLSGGNEGGTDVGDEGSPPEEHTDVEPF